jgi:hypothetical protein
VRRQCLFDIGISKTNLNPSLLSVCQISLLELSVGGFATPFARPQLFAIPRASCLLQCFPSTDHIFEHDVSTVPPRSLEDHSQYTRHLRVNGVECSKTLSFEADAWIGSRRLGHDIDSSNAKLEGWSPCCTQEPSGFLPYVKWK